MQYLISTRVTQFAYFDEQLDHPPWKGRTILDFGGNIGTFLVGAGAAVDHDDYWCIDLNETVIERGRQAYPRAHFVHYNRYSAQYNPAGVRLLPIPDCGVAFDFILAFSVFTHVHQREMLDLVGQLRAMLTPGGVLAFTFTDPSYDRSLSNPKLSAGTDVRKMLEREQAKNPALDIEEMVEEARRAPWCILIDDQLYVEPGEALDHQNRQGRPWESYCTYYQTDYLASLFSDAEVRPPISPDWQHCCILRQ